MPSIYPSQVICVLQLLSRSKVVYSLLLQKGYEMICKRTEAFCILERWTLFWIWPNMRKMVGFIGRLRCIIPGSGIYMYIWQSPIIDFLSNHFCTWWEKLLKLLRFSNTLQLALVYVTRRPTIIQYKLLVLLIKVIKFAYLPVCLLYSFRLPVIWSLVWYRESAGYLDYLCVIMNKESATCGLLKLNGNFTDNCIIDMHVCCTHYMLVEG